MSVYIWVWQFLCIFGRCNMCVYWGVDLCILGRCNMCQYASTDNQRKENGLQERKCFMALQNINQTKSGIYQKKG